MNGEFRHHSAGVEHLPCNRFGEMGKPAHAQETSMLKFFKTAALSLALGMGALGVAPASADTGVYLGLGGGHRGGPEVGLWLGDSGHSYRRGDRWDDRRGDRWDDRRGGRWDDRRGYGCHPGQALNKASRMGVRRARIEHVGHRSIKVSGRSRGDYVSVRFARAPGCPVIRGGW
jgi:hypothetical protein